MMIRETTTRRSAAPFSRRATVFAAAALALLALGLPLSAQTGSFRLTPLEGAGEFTPKSLEKGNTIVVVWASWSPRCRDITTQVDAMNKRWRDQAKVVTVNFQEKPDAIRQALSKEKMPVPVYLDSSGAFSKMHAVTTVPHVLVYQDGKKILAQRLTREIDDVIATKIAP